MGIKVPPGRCKGCFQPTGSDKARWCATCRPAPKYHSRKVTLQTPRGTLTFASRKEADRYAQLALLEKHGHIKGLVTQVPFRLDVNGKLVCRYIADFVYVDNSSQKTVVEDAKGLRTPYYKLKARLFLAVFGFPITEV